METYYAEAERALRLVQELTFVIRASTPTDRVAIELLEDIYSDSGEVIEKLAQARAAHRERLEAQVAAIKQEIITNELEAS